MKTIKISLVAICTIFASQLHAQTKIKVSDLSIQVGGLINPTVSGNNISLLTLAQEKESNLLKNVDLSNYKKYNSSN